MEIILAKFFVNIGAQGLVHVSSFTKMPQVVSLQKWSLRDDVRA